MHTIQQPWLRKTLGLLCPSDPIFATVLGKNKSSFLPATSGTFQGAILSPSPFLPHVNKLPIFPNLVDYKYADDFVCGCLYNAKDSPSYLTSNSTASPPSLNVFTCVGVPFYLLPVFSDLLPATVTDYIAKDLTRNLYWANLLGLCSTRCSCQLPIYGFSRFFTLFC